MSVTTRAADAVTVRTDASVTDLVRATPEDDPNVSEECRPFVVAALADRRTAIERRSREFDPGG